MTNQVTKQFVVVNDVEGPNDTQSLGRITIFDDEGNPIDVGGGAKGEKGEKGDKGDPGFPSESDWNALVARVEGLEGDV